MKTKRLISLHFLTFMIIPVLAFLAESERITLAATAPMTEVRVSLFGQPCILQGPLDRATLKAIHTISPEQMYAGTTLSDSSEAARKSLDKIRGATSLPSMLDRYREKLGRRIEAQIAFIDGVESTLKSHRATALLKAAKTYLAPKKVKGFDAIALRLESTSLPHDKRRELIDQLYDYFNENIEQEAEEEFHRAIQRMNVQYTCSFEEGGGETDADSD